MERLRITGGEMRGRKIFSPPKNSIRPASDFIRQAVFNMVATQVPGSHFFDVFAGTGIVGLEALSRGAKRVTFVEHDRKQHQLIVRNLQHLQRQSQADVRMADALLWSEHFVPDRDPVIVFLGPPYPLFEGKQEARILAMVERLQEKLRPEDTLVFQFPRSVTADQLPAAAEWFRVRHYGKSSVGIYRSPSMASVNPTVEHE